MVGAGAAVVGASVTSSVSGSVSASVVAASVSASAVVVSSASPPHSGRFDSDGQTHRPS